MYFHFMPFILIEMAQVVDNSSSWPARIKFCDVIRRQWVNWSPRYDLWHNWTWPIIIASDSDSTPDCLPVIVWTIDDLVFIPPYIAHWGLVTHIWVRSRNCGCLVTWFCYYLIAKPGNKTAALSWPDPYASVNWVNIISDNGLLPVWCQAII